MYLQRMCAWSSIARLKVSMSSCRCAHVDCFHVSCAERARAMASAIYISRGHDVTLSVGRCCICRSLWNGALTEIGHRRCVQAGWHRRNFDNITHVDQTTHHWRYLTSSGLVHGIFPRNAPVAGFLHDSAPGLSCLAGS